jgi:hypothetical protein
MFVQFTNAHTNKPILINTDHVRTVAEVADNVVRLAMDADHAEIVEGDFRYVQEMPTNKWASQAQT